MNKKIPLSFFFVWILLLSPGKHAATTLKSTRKDHYWENKLKITPREAVPAPKLFLGGGASKKPLLLLLG